MTVFQDSDHFGSLWWQSFKTAITSAVFDGSAFLKRTLRGRFREKHRHDAKLTSKACHKHFTKHILNYSVLEIFKWQPWLNCCLSNHMSFVKALGLVFHFCCQTMEKTTQAQPSPGSGLVLLSTFGIMGQPNVGKSTQTECYGTSKLKKTNPNPTKPWAWMDFLSYKAAKSWKKQSRPSQNLQG